MSEVLFAINLKGELMYASYFKIDDKLLKTNLLDFLQNPPCFFTHVPIARKRSFEGHRLNWCRPKFNRESKNCSVCL